MFKDRCELEERFPKEKPGQTIHEGHREQVLDIFGGPQQDSRHRNPLVMEES